MSLYHAILGFLSRQPLTGYDLKKLFADSDLLYWSGNNNQIYRTLVQLHQEQLVTVTVEHQADKPSRKVYSITGPGREALRLWLLSPPELPQLRQPMLIRLLWSELLAPAELDGVLAAYAEELRVKQLMLQTQAGRSAPAGWLPLQVNAHWLAFYAQEQAWVAALRQQLAGG